MFVFLRKNVTLLFFFLAHFVIALTRTLTTFLTIYKEILTEVWNMIGKRKRKIILIILLD